MGVPAHINSWMLLYPAAEIAPSNAGNNFASGKYLAVRKSRPAGTIDFPVLSTGFFVIRT